jgi:hypothetical protein
MFFQYAWISEKSTKSIDVKVAGTYSVVVTNKNACIE